MQSTFGFNTELNETRTMLVFPTAAEWGMCAAMALQVRHLTAQYHPSQRRWSMFGMNFSC